MTAARISTPLDPFRTDADWSQDFVFTDEDWTGSDVTVSLVRKTSGGGITLTVGDGLLAPTEELSAAIRVTAAQLAGLRDGDYVGSVRRLIPGGAIDAAAEFTVTVGKGLTHLLAVGGTTSLLGATVGATVTIDRDSSGFRIVRSGGTVGKSAYQAALDAGIIPPDTTETEYAALPVEAAAAAATAATAADAAAGYANTAADGANAAADEVTLLLDLISPPAGFLFLVDTDGAYITDPEDGAYLLVPEIA